MNPGTFYFYHYMPNHPPCNVGFLKLNSQFPSCTIELHIRNIPVSQGDELKLGAFYPEDTRLVALPLSDITAKTNAVFAKYDLPEALLSQHALSELGGFFLILPDNTPIAAVAPGITFRPEALHFTQTTDARTSMTEDTHAVPDMPPVKGTPAAAVPSSAERTSADSDAPMSMETTAESGAPSSAETSATDEPACDAPNAGPTPNERTMPVMPTTLANEAPAVNDVAPSVDDVAPSVDDAAPEQIVRKIKRQELRILPRKYWNLSNNSFLMHGYYNYNHLLLVEKDGYYLVGVPGIYSTREAHAASLFGFPRFTDEYNGTMRLTSEEQNTYSTFGYWCCEVPASSSN